MPVCYQFAERGTCRFGETCRFEHVAAAVVADTQTTASLAPPRNHIEHFFSQYPSFDYDRERSFIEEFFRMCRHFRWNRDSKEKDQARADLQHAMVLQFNETYGTDAENLEHWQNLCEVIGIRAVPNNLKACRGVVVSSHVNICDLIDAPLLGTTPEKFPSEAALSAYTKETGKYFSRGDMDEGSLLRYLLRHIISPRQTNPSTRRRRRKL